MPCNMRPILDAMVDSCVYMHAVWRPTEVAFDADWRTTGGHDGTMTDGGGTA